MTTESPRAAAGPDDPMLHAYLMANRGRYTDDALLEAAANAGYRREVVLEAIAALPPLESTAPTRKRAVLVVLGSYAVVFALLAASMAANGNGNLNVILAISMGLGALISIPFLRRGPRMAPGAQLAMGGLIAVPLVLLVLIAGTCLASGMPFHGFLL
jgi:hypothetical protein